MPHAKGSATSCKSGYRGWSFLEIPATKRCAGESCGVGHMLRNVLLILSDYV